jgi:large subunit ribosomal protein L5e
LKILGLDEKYTGVGNEEEDEVTAELMTVEFNKRKYFVDELDAERRPFRCFLDVGLARTSQGARIFGCLKGATDAGLDIPHSPKRFPGYDKDTKQYDAEVHKGFIFGEPIKEYMETLLEDDAESGTNRFGEQFATYKDAGIGPDDLEELYKAVHKAIRADPSKLHAEPVSKRNAGKKHDLSRKKKARLTKEERDAAIQKKLDILKAAKSAGAEDEAEEEGAEEDGGDEGY